MAKSATQICTQFSGTQLSGDLSGVLAIRPRCYYKAPLFNDIIVHCAIYSRPTPPKTAHSYNTRPRHHNFSLIEQSTDVV